MAILFDQERYIESVVGIVKEFLTSKLPDTEFPVAFPDIADDNLVLTKPVVYIEFHSSVNLDSNAGRNNGRGQRVKRKMVRMSFQVLSTGENTAVLQRDRVAQKIEYEFCKEENVKQLASQGFSDIDVRFANSYRVREGVHLARLELFAKIKIVN